MLYAIWCACERFSVLPPGVKSRWEDCDDPTQMNMIAFNQIRTREELERAQIGVPS